MGASLSEPCTGNDQKSYSVHLLVGKEPGAAEDIKAVDAAGRVPTELVEEIRNRHRRGRLASGEVIQNHRLLLVMSSSFEAGCAALLLVHPANQNHLWALVVSEKPWLNIVDVDRILSNANLPRGRWTHHLCSFARNHVSVGWIDDKGCLVLENLDTVPPSTRLIMDFVERGSQQERRQADWVEVEDDPDWSHYELMLSGRSPMNDGDCVTVAVVKRFRTWPEYVTSRFLIAFCDHGHDAPDVFRNIQQQDVPPRSTR